MSGESEWTTNDRQATGRSAYWKLIKLESGHSKTHSDKLVVVAVVVSAK